MSGRVTRVVAATLASLAAVAAPLLPALPASAVDPPVPPVQERPVELVIEKISPAVLEAEKHADRGGHGRQPRHGSAARRCGVPGPAPARLHQLVAIVADRRRAPRPVAERRRDRRPPAVPEGGRARGGGASWKFSVKVEDLKLPGNGVYAIGVAVARRGSSAPAARSTPGPPSCPTCPSRRATARPRSAGCGRSSATRSASPTGCSPPSSPEASSPSRAGLADLADAPGKHPVAWMLDPQLLDDATALAATHRQRAATRS